MQKKDVLIPLEIFYGLLDQKINTAGEADDSKAPTSSDKHGAACQLLPRKDTTY